MKYKEIEGNLITLAEDGKFYNQTNLTQIRGELLNQ